MWSALENIALRESLPKPLQPGQSVHDILVAGQLDRGRHNLHHLGRRRSQPYLLKQFYSINTDAFLRWQNEARFISLPQTSGYTWPCEEWRGGLIAPFPDGTPLDAWLGEDEYRLQDRLEIGAMLSLQVARLHASGIAHRGLSPSCIRIGDQGVSITDFGYARCDEWDDFWADSIMAPGDATCASPESLNGEDSAYNEDVHAFGAILHLLLSGKTPFGTIKMMLRPVMPKLVTPDALPETQSIPDTVRELVSACLSPTPSDRPFMDEAVSILAHACGQGRPPIEKIDIPPLDDSAADKNKVMVFVKDDNRAVSLFDATLRQAEDNPSVFLFVGLVPNNLPSGHAERFRGNMFKKLGQGLIRCRAAGVPWSLRVLENTDPERTAVELVRQYQPDQVYIGASEAGTSSLQQRFPQALASENIHIESIP